MKFLQSVLDITPVVQRQATTVRNISVRNIWVRNISVLHWEQFVGDTLPRES